MPVEGTPQETGTGNPYADVAAAQAYFDLRLNVDPWEDASDSDKSRALNQATLDIDKLVFRGAKTDSSQERKFPRDEATTVPTPVVQACCELALVYLDDIDPEDEVDHLRARNQGFAGARTTFDADSTPEWVMAGIPSHRAWILLKPYLADSRRISLQRA